MWHEGNTTWGRATIGPDVWAPGTRRPRLGLLFLLADVVASRRVTGTLTPTIDLRFQLLAAAPSEGHVLMESRPLKVGRRLWIGEVLFRTSGAANAFGRCELNFVNQRFADGAESESRTPLSDGLLPRPTLSFNDLFAMRLLDDGATEMDARVAARTDMVAPHQGGAQATMAEVAAERVLADRGKYTVSDLHVRFLNPLKVGPAIARPTVLPGDDLRPVVRVSLTDEGAGGRLVSTAVAVCRPEPAS